MDDGRIIDTQRTPLVAQFDYSFRKDGMCLYTGDRYFDEMDKPVTDPAKDKPSRTINCCKARFGRNKPLYF
ncbi:hypothetical protein H2O14_00980 [Rhizobium sp. G21]|nr:hypothetical protein [Rhizobium sp. G21]